VMGAGVGRLVWRVNEPKRMGARSSWALTRGQNPLVINMCLANYGASEAINLCSRYVEKSMLGTKMRQFFKDIVQSKKRGIKRGTIRTVMTSHTIADVF
jgi:hypothetical protein